ncbi:tetratricopeptide repeat protein 37-like [Uloborus diversus]|uniref:tetratricopeptide repeat protein 37-like n=1 Tax=Uloborus diversus TaxID=327109 RepID=UPI00240A8007|nr:tetratricopeptide repeat protein 37-like [Uloborus diversus]
MDAKEIKSLLKQARECLKEKDYKAALKHCKTVLKTDKNNYNAWVFVGAAAQELDEPEQGEAAFRKAIEISPDQLLAWQGLCSFYEKQEKEEHNEELLSVYEKLIDLLHSDKVKMLEMYDKLISILRKMNKKEKLLGVLRSKLDVVKDDSEGKYLVNKLIFEEICGQVQLGENEKKIQMEALQCIIDHEKFSEADIKRIFSTFIENLVKCSNEQYSLSLALMIYKKFPDSPTCLEFLCRLGMKLYIDNNTVIGGIDELSEKISKCDMIKGIALIFQGYTYLIAKKYVEAILSIKQGLKTVESCLEGWYFLTEIHLKLHQYKDAEKNAKIGIDLSMKRTTSSSMIGKFYLLLGQALCGKQNFNAAIKSFEKCIQYLGQSKEIMISFCQTLLKIEEVEKAEKICNELKAKYSDDADVMLIEGYILLLKKEYSAALAKLKESIKLKESAFTLHLIATSLWFSEQHEKAFKIFSKAIELDPYFAMNFLYLGHYYRNHLLDKSKACLCYQKAFTLDNADFEIGLNFSQTLKEMGKEEENVKVLKIITENASLGSCKWAWTQLGLYQLKTNPSDAIFSFQNAVRADPNNSHTWECLADAYLKRGSYESALKAFERAAEINTNAMYPLYQIATIQKLRGFYPEAVEKHKVLLEVAPTYVPALIGLAETYVLYAKKSFSDCLYGLSRDYCQEALNVLSRVAASNTGLSSLWKLAGDACTLLFHLDEKWFPVTVPHQLHQKIETEAVVCNKSEILMYGSKFFGRAIVIKDNVSTLWHDLGVSYYYQSLLHFDSNTKVEFAKKKAFVCFQKAVSIAAQYQAHWIALGVVAIGKGLNDDAFGQHALIQSLEINPNNAETWTNLGILYLEKGNIELANAAFVKAQSTEPTYPLSWIGQAFIADKIAHAETMDLYRHASTLGSHTEALLGYSRIVCKTLLDTTNKNTEAYRYNIEQMNAIVVAVDCAEKFIGNKNTVPEAFNILGMLLERRCIYNASLNSYKRALDLFQENGQAENVEIVRANYARLLCVNGHINEAIKEFLLLKKVDTSLLCSFAVAFLKAKQYEQSFKLFKQAFEKAKSNADKSHIKVAMAIVARNLQGSDFPNPLTLLFESSQLSPASVPGLLALCAVGILKNERDLSLAAQKELQPYKYHKDYCPSIALLWASQAYLLKGAKAGRNEMLSFIRCVPNNGEMWLQMASCLLQFNSEYANTAAYCTKVSSFHNGNKEQLSQIFALSRMSEGYRKGALSAAQKAVHLNPAHLSNWVTLAAACHVAEKDRKNTGWMFSFVKKLAKEQGIESDMLGALIILEAFHYICENKFMDANRLLSKAVSVTSFNAEIQSALQILDATVKVFLNKGSLDSLVIAMKNNQNSFLGWHILSQLLMSSGRFFEAEKTISKFAITAEKLFPKWTTFPLLQLAVMSYKAMNVNIDEREKWLKLGEEASGKAVHLFPSSQAARFMQGLFALESGNKNLARRSFEKVVSDPVIKEPKWMEKAAKCIMDINNLKRKADKDQETS